MSGAHILVVDDDPKVRTLLRRCFESEGFAVSDAKDGAELRACLERNSGRACGRRQKTHLVLRGARLDDRTDSGCGR